VAKTGMRLAFALQISKLCRGLNIGPQIDDMDDEAKYLHT